MATKTQGLRIRTKLLAMVVMLVFISIIVGGFSFYGVSESIDSFRSQLLPELTTIHQIDYTVAKARRYEKEFFLFSSIPKNDKVLEKQSGYLQEMTQTFEKLRPQLKTLGTAGLAEEVATENLENQAAAYKLVNTLKSDYSKVRDAMKPLTEQLMAGKSFLQVSEHYSVYKGAVHDLEGHIKEMIGLLNAMEVQQRASSDIFQEQMFLTLLGLSLGLLMFGILAGLFVSNRITAPLNTLMEGISSVGDGEIVDIKVNSKDEFAEIARVFNEAMGRLSGYIRTEDQRKVTEENVINFLEVVSEAAEGDLTLRAPVTEDAFGSIADAYNLMIESLASLLTDSSINAEEVGEESRHLLDIFTRMKENADSQLNHVTEATDAAEMTADSATQIAEKTSLAQKAAARVDEATTLGNERVNLNIEGMQLIRVTVQVINKKMKSLAERLLEIGTISQLISDVATRTTILAMNASIEASRAGEQGRGFLVISDEIKRLADEASEATRKIGGIIKAIQSEANEVTAALEEETSTVEKQTRLAQDTGEALTAINTATNESKQVVTEITSLSQDQLRISEGMVQSIRNMAAMTAKTSALITESSAISEGLNGVSESLLQSLAQFRLGGESSSEKPIEIAAEDIVSEAFPPMESAQNA